MIELLPPDFPHHAIPDGTVRAPHHYTYLLLAAIGAAGTVWDDYRDKEPIVVVGLLVGSLIAFNLMWPLEHYHPYAPLATIILPIIAILAIALPIGNWRFWWFEGSKPYPLGTSWVVVLLILGALDDAVEHAFGTSTPLDWFFGTFGVGASIIFGVVILAFGAIVMWNWDHLYKILGLAPSE